MALLKRLIGLEEFVIPDEESRTKQYREIAQLLAEAPIVARSRASAPAETGEEIGAEGSGGAGAFAVAPDVELALPSVMPDEFADNHAVELETCMRWFSSDAGQVAKLENPTGYTNVRAHALFHREYLLKQQRQAEAQQAGSQRASTSPQNSKPLTV